MSLKTWKAEFYPVAPKKSMTTKEAIEHSLAKWIGLRKKNLKKHGITVGFFRDAMFDDSSAKGFEINGSTCALCKKFYNHDAENECEKCPLFSVLGKACDDGDNDDSPFYLWMLEKKPEPMIKALKKALKEHKDE